MIDIGPMMAEFLMKDIYNELAKEVGFGEKLTDREPVGTPPNLLNRLLQEYTKRVIKECIQVMVSTANKAKEENTHMGDDVPLFVYIDSIKEHFGVE